ncbi:MULTISPECIES: DUF3572 domain-containing protein [unclassified Sphingomonas]|uniref:DUF3572 domain-containing protein n=1 Tax=unclassified Sphingomonas TaxID=196159 RepID=UPI000BCC3EDE|nr:MAG: hypothetical protein B7Y98_05515 [Sphingomonas sp. 32-62-10]
MRPPVTNRDSAEDAGLIGLRALGWALSDGDRASRLLALTGLDPQALRANATEPATLVAVLGFLESHEPDLVACADALAITPAALVRARQLLDTP